MGRRNRTDQLHDRAARATEGAWPEAVPAEDRRVVAGGHGLGAPSEDWEEVSPSDRSVRSANWLGDFVYGTIGTLAVVEGLTLDGSSLGGLEAVGAVLVGAISIWMAHGVSRLVAERARRSSVLHLGDVVGEFRSTWPIIAAALPATIVLILADRHVLSVSRGLTISGIVGVVALAGAGIGSARGARRSWFRQVTYVLALTAAGAAIVALEVGVRHL